MKFRSLALVSVLVAMTSPVFAQIADVPEECPDCVVNNAAPSVCSNVFPNGVPQSGALASCYVRTTSFGPRSYIDLAVLDEVSVSSDARVWLVLSQDGAVWWIPISGANLQCASAIELPQSVDRTRPFVASLFITGSVSGLTLFCEESDSGLYQSY